MTSVRRPWSPQQVGVASLCLAQVLLRVGLFPGPPPLGSLVALGCRGILWLDPSRQLRSARAGPPPRAVLPLFLPVQTQKTIIKNQGELHKHSASLFVFLEQHLHLVRFCHSPFHRGPYVSPGF